MKCVICRGDDITLKVVEEEFRVGSDVVLVPVEVLVCASCGERYYDRKTMRSLEDTEEKLKRKEIPLDAVGRVLKPSSV
jgi:YgiT-type zinc finger domain-containing protein